MLLISSGAGHSLVIAKDLSPNPSIFVNSGTKLPERTTAVFLDITGALTTAGSFSLTGSFSFTGSFAFEAPPDFFFGVCFFEGAFFSGTFFSGAFFSGAGGVATFSTDGTGVVSAVLVAPVAIPPF